MGWKLDHWITELTIGSNEDVKIRCCGWVDVSNEPAVDTLELATVLRLQPMDAECAGVVGAAGTRRADGGDNQHPGPHPLGVNPLYVEASGAGDL